MMVIAIPVGWRRSNLNPELDLALAATASNKPVQASSQSLKTAPNSASVTTGTGSSPTSNRWRSLSIGESRGSRRSAPTVGKSSRRQLGAGLVSIPELPPTTPELAILAEAKVPENKRFVRLAIKRRNATRVFVPNAGKNIISYRVWYLEMSSANSMKSRARSRMVDWAGSISASTDYYRGMSCSRGY